MEVIIERPAADLSSIDIDDIADDVAQEFLRQSERRLEATFTASLGMDQRAAVLAAGFIAAAGALAGGGLAIADHTRLSASAFAACLFMIIAAICCCWACRPQISNFPGIYPREWATGGKYLNNRLQKIRMGQAFRLEDRINQNEANQKKNGRVLMIGMFSAATAIAAAPIAYGIASALNL